MMKLEPNRQKPDEARVLSKATVRAAEYLEISGATLSEIIGVSGPTISRMKKLDYTLEPGSKPFELAILFVRVFRSLDAITGGDARVAREWLRNKNTVFDANPIDEIKKVAGLNDVLNYLDSYRAII
jgi:hypothetical protein